MSTETDTMLAAHLAEYEKLKDEQADRIGRRDGLVYASLTAAAAAGFAALQAHYPGALLAVPLVGFLLGWTYLANDVLITQQGDYIRDQLGPCVTGLTGGPAAFGWEHNRHDDTRRRQRKCIQLAVDLGAFVGPGLVALGLGAARGPIAWWAVLIGLVDVAALSVLAWQIVAYSPVARSR